MEPQISPGVPRRPIGTWLLRLVLMSILPVAIAASIVVVLVARHQLESAQASLVETTRALAIAVDFGVEEDIRRLEHMAAAAGLGPKRREALAEEAARRVGAGEFLEMTLVDRAGRVLVSVPNAPAELTTLLEWEPVRTVLATGKPAVSDVLTFPLTGRKGVAIAVPVRDGNQVAAVLVASPDFARQLLQALPAAAPYRRGRDDHGPAGRVHRADDQSRGVDRAAGEPGVPRARAGGAGGHRQKREPRGSDVLRHLRPHVVRLDHRPRHAGRADGSAVSARVRDARGAACGERRRRGGARGPVRPAHRRRARAPRRRGRRHRRRTGARRARREHCRGRRRPLRAGGGGQLPRGAARARRRAARPAGAGEPGQGRVPGHARPRAAQSAGGDRERGRGAEAHAARRGRTPRAGRDRAPGAPPGPPARRPPRRRPHRLGQDHARVDRRRSRRMRATRARGAACRRASGRARGRDQPRAGAGCAAIRCAWSRSSPIC